MQICVGRVPYIVYTYRTQETEASTAGAFGSTKWIAWKVGVGGATASSVQELFGSPKCRHNPERRRAEREGERATKWESGSTTKQKQLESHCSFNSATVLFY